MPLTFYLSSSLLALLLSIPLHLVHSKEFPCPLPAQPGQPAIPEAQRFVAQPEYQAEWYYVTGSLCHVSNPALAVAAKQHRLIDECENPVGFQLTTFMRNVSLPDGSTHIFTDSVIAVTDRKQHYDVSAVGGKPIYPTHQPFDLIFLSALPKSSIEYRLTAGVAGHPNSVYHFITETENVTFDLVLESESPLMLQGANGYSGYPYAEYCVSNYYLSMPQMTTTGIIRVNDELMHVSGLSWFDHEWGTNTAPTIGGWIWLGLRVNDASFMLTIPRENGVNVFPFSMVNLMYNDATMLHGAIKDMHVLSNWTSPATKITYPIGVRIFTSLADASELLITPVFLDQEVAEPTYNPPQYFWEGLVSVKVINGSKLAGMKGDGYLELVGFGAPSK